MPARVLSFGAVAFVLGCVLLFVPLSAPATGGAHPQVAAACGSPVRPAPDLTATGRPLSAAQRQAVETCHDVRFRNSFLAGFFLLGGLLSCAFALIRYRRLTR